ncbi:unnamed protein product [Pieris brassicae]|uniref:Xaa-Pro aminopeptidase 1 n=1 Tax=Pieris brassicae TaxID=7116 RepID=A0A9P0TR51_PIEBR|nr:unnamed protein product [Pieris brassicae]
MNIIVLLAVFCAECSAVRVAYVPTTSTNAMPTTTQMTTPSMLQELTPPPPACPEASSLTNPLGKLRIAMKNSTYLDAFLVFFSDEHLSEEPSPDERRLEYISGWDGAGTAAVLAAGGAAIWVPAVNVRRAKMSLSCAWLVLDGDDPSQPTIAEWIGGTAIRNGRVGGDVRLTSFGEWQALSTSLQRENLQLVPQSTLLDQLWNQETDPMWKRPQFTRVVAMSHNSEFTGMSWREKLSSVRNELQAVGADAMIVTALDEVAWLLNLRGKDLPYAPLLKAFVLVTHRDVRIYVPPGKLMMPERDMLAAYNCYPNVVNCTSVKDYETVYSDLRKAVDLNKILIPTGGTFQRGASAAITQAITASKRLFQPSPIIYLKAQKNMAEIKGMKKAHLRDAVAMCTVLNYLEKKGKSNLNELLVGEKIDATRATQAGYRGLSMRTRVAFGPNAAEPEYQATNATNRRIFSNSTLIIQSGGQYDEGTTVVTRTLHYGTPSRDERRAYTMVLRSLAAFATLQAPSTLPAAHADPVARAPLWSFRQDYLLPTGHGVGAALNRREDPVVIDYRQDTNLHTFREGYFVTNEPAWHDPRKFGIKLSNVLEVVQRSSGYLGFKETTLLPYEPKLIDRNLLTDYEINWLNAYNKRIRETVGPELTAQGLTDVYYWVMNKTIEIELPSKNKKASNSAIIHRVSALLIFIFAVNAFK